MEIISESAKEKIQLIDRLRDRLDVLRDAKINFPQIIVVGDQSTGKSSVLQAISGISLPRGHGTVTLCPTVMQLRYSDNIETLKIKFKDENYRTITEPDKEIEQIQKRLNKTISDDKISLMKEGSKMPTLTIVDLPGLVKTPSDNQSVDVVRKTLEMAESYMNQEQSLILCVLPANRDINSTDTIQLAKKANSDHSRIIGVLTNMDRVDDQEVPMVTEVLKNNKISLQKGYYGILVGDDFIKCSESERQIKEDSIFRRFYGCREQLGLKKLVAALQRELTAIIEKNLPLLKTTINGRLCEMENELKQFSIYKYNKQMQQQLLIKTTDVVKSNITKCLDEGTCKIKCYGKFSTAMKKIDKNSDDICTFLYCWNMIYKQFNTNLDKLYKDKFEFSKSPYGNTDLLSKLVSKTQTDNMAAFVNSEPFREIIESVLIEVEGLSMDVLKLIYNMIMTLMSNGDIIPNTDILNIFNTLTVDLIKILTDQLEVQRSSSAEMIKFILRTERRYYCPDKFLLQSDGNKNNNKTDDGSNGVRPVKSITPIMPTPQYNGDVNSIGLNNIQNSLNNPPSTQNGVVRRESALSADKSHNDNISYLRLQLQKYIEELLRRMKIVIPNTISTILFHDYVDEIYSQMLSFITSDSINQYFQLSDDDRARISQIQRTIDELKSAHSEIDQVNKSDVSSKVPIF